MPDIPLVPRELAPAPRTVIYTDGSCFNNGKRRALGGCGIHYPADPSRDVSLPLETREQSNNLAELRAVIEAVEQTRGPLEINLIPSMS